MRKLTQIIIVFFLCCVTLFFVYKSGFRYQAEYQEQLRQQNVTSDLCPLRNFVFVKTHKTGSSTMSNILLRYSENNKLNQLMGRYPTGTEYGDLSQHNYPPPPSHEHYNAFLMHADYNYEFLRSKLPINTKFFTFVRDPVSRYISAFNFFKHKNAYDPINFDNAIKLHLEDNSDYLINTHKCKNCQNTVDSVAVDLGFNLKEYVKSHDRAAYIKAFLGKKDEELDLVLLSDQYDLSLVLMARRYCWTFDDISYLRSLESSSKPFVREETKTKVLKFQKIDAAIYEHYNKTFWELVKKEEGILEEVEEFKKHNAAMHDKCVAGKTNGAFNTYQYILTEFGDTDFQCKAMSSRVLPFAHLIEKRNQGLRNDGPHQRSYLSLQELYDVRYGKGN